MSSHTGSIRPCYRTGGLIAAAETRAAELPPDVKITADSSVRKHRFDADVEGAAYFVICEALTNVAKHAAATGTEVAVRTGDGQLSVQVRDDGTGFMMNGRSGVGPTNLRDRVEALGGQLSIEATPGAGTTVRAELPVTANGAPHG